MLRVHPAWWNGPSNKLAQGSGAVSSALLPCRGACPSVSRFPFRSRPRSKARQQPIQEQQRQSRMGQEQVQVQQRQVQVPQKQVQQQEQVQQG